MEREVRVKAETRNHRGAFVPSSVYRLVDINASGWALICVNDVCCHYVDPDALTEEDVA